MVKYTWPLFILFYAVSGWTGLAAGQGGQKPALSISFQDGALVFSAEKASVGQCLEGIQQEFEVAIVGLEDRADESVTVTCEGETLQDVLVRFLKYLGIGNYAFEYDHEKLTRVSVFPEGGLDSTEPPMDIPRIEHRPATAPAVEILEVFEGSQAEALGLEEGDVIVAYQGVRITSAYHLWQEVKKQTASDQVDMLAMRNGEPMPLILNGGLIGIRIKTVKVFQEEIDGVFPQR